MEEKIELLSPAGDLEKLKIAFLYGADACYIGGKRFSLRANATNFDLKQIEEATSYAHRLGKKLYVAVNILFHNEDVKGLYEYLENLDKIGVDAVIIADVFLIKWIKKNCKNLQVFLSTQQSITNIEAVKFFLKQGVDRIVLARELSKEKIKNIYDNTHANLEVFLHGAMCTCYSGRCLLSNYLTNRDSNRGGCSQACRFSYELDKKNHKFSIASKDLMLANNIKELIETGAKSLKVEGRMRSTYYLATVISSYRKLIDAYYNNGYQDKIIKNEEKILSRVSNRPSSNHFFDHENNHKDQYYLETREEVSNQDFLGFVKNYDQKNNLLVIEQRNYFKVNDKVHFFGPNNFSYDFVIQEMYNVDMQPVSVANHPKEIIKIKIDRPVPKNSFMRICFDNDTLTK